MKNIEKFAKKYNIEINCWAGSGDFGEAYHTECGKIIKETSDVAEFLIAAKLEGEKNDNIVDIYKTDIIDNQMYIFMEELNLGSIEDEFSEIFLKLEDIGIQINEFDESDLYEYNVHFSDDEICFINDIQLAIKQYQFYGYNPTDIQSGNIGRKENGNIALFDQRDVIFNKKELLEEYKAERNIKPKKKKSSFKP